MRWFYGVAMDTLIMGVVGLFFGAGAMALAIWLMSIMVLP